MLIHHEEGHMPPKIPIGLQLYSIRHECEKDLAGSLAKVAEMGYDGVEFAGYYGHDAKEIKSLLKKTGLRCCGSHTGWAAVQPGALEATVAYNEAIGNKYIIVPGLPPERQASRAAWLQTAASFNDLAAKLAPNSMLTGYHNHFVEFTPLDGELPWDTLFSNTGPNVVMQLDTGNARHGGADPATFLMRYPGRAITVHLKAYSAANDTALIGEDDEDWQRIFHLCETVGGTKWYIVEYEKDVPSMMDAVAGCVRNLRNMGK
jgi:sugar phosphate isomerase/epimerase